MANYTIDVNSMTKTYGNMAKCLGAKETMPSGTEFSDYILKKIKNKGAVSPKEMTMEEYRQYIYGRISQIALHPSQSGWQWHVEITDEGLEAMKNDPEYEEYVFHAVRANFSFRDPYQSWNYSVLHFGATKEESYGQSFGGGSRVWKEHEETYWERRQKRRKRLQEELEEIQEQKAIAKRFATEKYHAKLTQIKADPDCGITDMQTPDAVAAYEANILAYLISRLHVEV